jgi:hypothetical protein
LSSIFLSTPTAPACARFDISPSKSHWATSTPSLPNATPFRGGCVCDMTRLCTVLCHVCALPPTHLHFVRETPSLIQRRAGEVARVLSDWEGVLSDWEGADRLLPKSSSVPSSSPESQRHTTWNGWETCTSVVCRRVPSMGPPRCCGALGFTPHGKNSGCSTISQACPGPFCQFSTCQC